MGEGKYIGRRYIFIRFKGCPLKCIYCDECVKNNITPRVEEIPGSGIFREYQNIENILIETINHLKTPDLFAISFTGGEPLLHHKKIRTYSMELRELGYKTHLESNGIYPERLFYFDYASIDIKLPEHFFDFDIEHKNFNLNIERYEKIYNLELKSIEKLYNMGSRVYAKIVIMENTNIESIENIAKDLSDIGDITLCIQPVTPLYNIKPPSQRKLLDIMKLCGYYLGDNLICTPQIHKHLKML